MTANHTVSIDRPGQTTETVAANLTPERAYALALAIRNTVRPGEILWTGNSDTQQVVHRR